MQIGIFLFSCKFKIDRVTLEIGTKRLFAVICRNEMAETSKISNSNSSVTIILPKFIAERMPFYTNPKERHFLQEVLSANQSILGTSLFVVIYVGIVLGVHSSFSMSRIGSDGTQVSEA